MGNLIRDYEQGISPLTDEEYDAFYAKEGEDLGTAGDIIHAQPLTSLRKYFVGEGTPPKLEGDCVELLKLDGLALSLFYEKGLLKTAAVRGDGTSGKNVTDKIIAAGIVPTILAGQKEDLQVDGEFLCRSKYPNARNIATGALVHIKSLSDFIARHKEYDFQFYAYRIGVGYTESFLEDMAKLKKWNFNTVLEATEEEWPCDGKVIRLIDNAKFYSSGITGNCTNGAYAVKTRKEGQATKLLNVIWQTSPKGRVSPVGILEPVDIDGAKVSRVTLHNVNFIRNAGVRYNADVKVIRAGDIIPRIVACEGGDKDIDIPANCPDCGGELEYDDTYLTCVNIECPAQCSKLVSHFFSSLGVKGFGIKTSEKFGLLPAEILKLPFESYSDIIGSTVGKKLYEQVQLLLKGVEQDALLQAMSIPAVGKTTASKLPKLSTWPNSIEEADIGEATKTKILEWYHTTFQDIWKGEWPLPVLDKIVQNKPSTGMKVCVTGKVAGYTRDSLHKKLVDLGLEPVSSVSSKVAYLLCEQPSSSSSYVKAQTLNIPIVTLKDLEEIFHDR